MTSIKDALRAAGFIALLAGACPLAYAQTADVEKIAMYRGADRQQMLEAGARKEGGLTWYSSAIVDQAIRPMVQAFEARYPGVKLRYVRDEPPRILQRVTTEIRAGKPVGDVMEGLGIEAAAKRANIARAFWSPSAEAIPAEKRDREQMWVPARYSFIGQAYNTNLVKAEDAPKSFQDLLDPKWKGRMAWGSGIAGAPMFIAGVMNAMGDAKGMDFLRALSKQQIAALGTNQRAVLDRVVAGEYAMSLDAFVHHPLISAKKGAPVAPLLLPPVLALVNSVMLTRNAPNPHAAMLFIDFLLSEEGQTVWRDAEYFPANPKVSALPYLDQVVPAKQGVPENVISPETVADQYAQGQKIFQELFH